MAILHCMVALVLVHYCNGIYVTREDLAKTVQFLTEKMDELKIKYESVENELAKLKTEHTIAENGLKNDISKLKSENMKMKQELASLKSASIAEKTLDTAKEQRRSVVNANSSGRPTNDSEKRIRQSSPYLLTQPIAFSAWINGDVSNLGDNQLYIFDHDVLNVGNHFSTVTGIFTAPINGIYAFFSTVLTYANKDLESEIVKNGVAFCRIYSGEDQYDGAGSNMALIQLKTGDKVWVRVHDKFHDTGRVIDGPWTTFTGFLLYEME